MCAYVCTCMCVCGCLCARVWCMYMDTLYHTYILYYTYLVAQLDSIIYHLLALYYCMAAPILTQGYVFWSCCDLETCGTIKNPTDNIKK